MNKKRRSEMTTNSIVAAVRKMNVEDVERIIDSAAQRADVCIPVAYYRDRFSHADGTPVRDDEWKQIVEQVSEGGDWFDPQSVHDLCEELGVEGDL